MISLNSFIIILPIMTTNQEQLQTVQITLRKTAEQLGELNLSNNKFYQSNQELSHDIKRLQVKIAKKTQMIEQEGKDKQIIHHKLVKAEEIKEQIEIRMEKIREKKEQEMIREQFKQEAADKHKEIKAQEMKTIHQEKQQKKKVDLKAPEIKKVQGSSNKAPLGPPAKSTPVQQAKPIYKIEASSIQTPNEQRFENLEKGEYQPPALFFQEENNENESDQDSEQDNSEVLQKLKKKLQQDRQQLQDD